MAMQDIADQAEGDNVLVVTHGDAVNSSVSRLMPWSIVYPVLHTGFTVAYRDQDQGMPLLAAPPLSMTLLLLLTMRHFTLVHCKALSNPAPLARLFAFPSSSSCWCPSTKGTSN